MYISILIMIIISLLIYIYFLKKTLNKEVQKDIEKILLEEYFKSKIIDIKKSISEILEFYYKEDKLEFINNLENELKEIEKEKDLSKKNYRLKEVEEEIYKYKLLEVEELKKLQKLADEREEEVSILQDKIYSEFRDELSGLDLPVILFVLEEIIIFEKNIEDFKDEEKTKKIMKKFHNFQNKKIITMNKILESIHKLDSLGILEESYLKKDGGK